MAYSTSNPPALISQKVGATGGSMWFYQSADALAAVRVSGYFTNGYALGMRAGDIVFVVDTDDYSGGVAIVNAANATTGVVDLNDGTAIAATDTD